MFLFSFKYFMNIAPIFVVYELFDIMVYNFLNPSDFYVFSVSDV